MSTANRKRRKELRQDTRDWKRLRPFDSYFPTLEELDRRLEKEDADELGNQPPKDSNDNA